MGRNNKGGNARGKARKPRDDTYRTDLLQKSDMQNDRLVAYYKAQKIVPEDEWEAFMASLQQHLPTTFRVAGSRQIAQSLNTTIEEIHVPGLTDIVFEGQSIPPPVQIPWYPDGLAWQFNVPKKVLRKSFEFKKFHSFLVFETEVGNISRQEAVSMLPPLFLDVEPHHKVMDMCAAPGSKTAQLLEALHAHDTVTSTSIPSGLLVANDSDYKRTHLLIHQSARLPSPALMVTNLDASNYPIIKIPGEKRLEQLLFDRILCDVPCSGDGTIRKNIGIWKSWQPNDGNGLHSLQLRILQRAMKLIKPDGRIVYSTCSLNPVENEAVIASALKSYPDFQLVDVSSKLPELHRRPGLTSWRPTADRLVGTTYETYEAFMQANPDAATTTKLTEGHWPPADAEALGLSRCMRIYPHLQDTGGFFVAVIERKAPSSVPSVSSKEKKRGPEEPEEMPETKKPRLADEESKPSATEPAEVQEAAPAVKSEQDSEVAETPKAAPTAEPKAETPEGNGGGSFKENPYTFLSPEDPILKACIERLHLTSSFPSSNVLVRNPEGDAARSLYLANDIVKTIVQNNDYARLRLNSAGTKVFSKQDGGRGVEPQFRVLGEGLPVILPYADPETIIIVDVASLRILVESYYPLCSTFAEPFRGVIEARPSGSHIIKVLPTNEDGTRLTHEIVLPLWKSNVSVTLMIDKKAKSALSLRLFGTDLTTAGRQASEQKRGAKASPAETPAPVEADTATPAAGEDKPDQDMADV